MPKKNDKKFLKEQGEKLKKEKKKIESRLENFGAKDSRTKTDWITKYPKFDSGHLEEEAEEVEEYDNLLSINYVLEEELKKINRAVEKFKKRKYGICEKCGKTIAKTRLKIYPQADYCAKCQFN